MHLIEHLARAHAKAEQTRTMVTLKPYGELPDSTCFNVFPDGSVSVHHENVRGQNLGLSVKQITDLVNAKVKWKQTRGTF